MFAKQAALANSTRTRAPAHVTRVAAVPRAELKRRTVLAVIPPTFISFIQFPQAANALDDFGGYLAKVFPPAPSPVKFPRKALDQRFAVLLMRSAYEAVDALDFVAMDEFQKNFWKLRQAEVEAYNIQQLPLKARQGDLTDPLYFDFISFSQYATINRQLDSPAQVFQEYCEECESSRRLVRRDAALADDKLLAQRHADMTGDLIYGSLVNGFRGEEFGGPAPRPRGSSLQQLTGDVQRILDIMVGRGYALKAKVGDLEQQPDGSGSFTVAVTAPANLWALEALAYRRAKVLNTYDKLVVGAYLRASGCQAAASEVQVSETGTETVWTVSAL